MLADPLCAHRRAMIVPFRAPASRSGGDGEQWVLSAAVALASRVRVLCRRGRRNLPFPTPASRRAEYERVPRCLDALERGRSCSSTIPRDRRTAAGSARWGMLA